MEDISSGCRQCKVKTCLAAEKAKQLQHKLLSQPDAATRQHSKPSRNQSCKTPAEPYIDLNGILHYPAHSENPGLEVKAWLEGERLHTQGVPPSLTDVIISLTTDNEPLQKKLLRKYVGVFAYPCWPRRVERWLYELAIIMAKDNLSREEAEYKAAASLHALPFLDDLRASCLNKDDKK